jgi:hypothetical protein
LRAEADRKEQTGDCSRRESESSHRNEANAAIAGFWSLGGNEISLISA